VEAWQVELVVQEVLQQDLAVQRLLEDFPILLEPL
jgi:hypothetical protein